MNDIKQLVKIEVRLRPAKPEDFLLSGGIGDEKYRFGKQYMVQMEDGTWRMEQLHDTVVSRRYFKMVYRESRVFVAENANEVGNIKVVPK
jgi:hypothetical protein